MGRKYTLLNDGFICHGYDASYEMISEDEDTVWLFGYLKTSVITFDIWTNAIRMTTFKVKSQSIDNCKMFGDCGKALRRTTQKTVKY